MTDIYRKTGFDFSNHVRQVFFPLSSLHSSAHQKRLIVRVVFGISSIERLLGSYLTVPLRRSGIFVFVVCRNDFLQTKGVKPPKATSTGTTIVGCLFKDGIVLGADTRATEGPIVADKNCEKVCSPLPPHLTLTSL